MEKSIIEQAEEFINRYGDRTLTIIERTKDLDYDMYIYHKELYDAVEEIYVDEYNELGRS